MFNHTEIVKVLILDETDYFCSNATCNVVRHTTPPTHVLLNSAETKAHDGISNYGVGTLKVIVNKWRGELIFGNIISYLRLAGQFGGNQDLL